MSLESGPLASKIQRDLELNRKLVQVLKEYWAKLGYVVDYSIHFNEGFNIHEIRSDDFARGLPKGQLSSIARRKLVI